MADDLNHRPRSSRARLRAAVVLLALVLAGCERSAHTPVPSSANTPAAPRFVGAAQCASCHAQQFAAWHGSQHDLAMQEASSATVRGRFDGATFGYAGIRSTFFMRDGHYFVNTDGPDGKLADFAIRYTFGVEPLQQYLVEFPDGRLQALSIAWDTRPAQAGGQRWFHLYPDEQLHAGDRLHWTGIDQNWNFMCADCHSTNVHKNFDTTANRFASRWSEINVACEACHGPGSNHVSWANKPTDDPTHGLTVALDERRGVAWNVDPASGNARRSAERRTHREIDVCAQCHARRAQIAEDYYAGKPWLDFYAPATLAAPLYYVDGQQHGEVYIWGSFLQSRMYAQGVTCSDCHDPHSQQLVAQGNGLCAQCHAASKYDTPAHHFHTAGNPGSACVDCHMTATNYMVIDGRRDHSFRVPRPDQTLRFGVPNACTGCHSKEGAAWADEAVQRWYGHRPAGFQTFAEAFDSATHGRAKARAMLAAHTSGAGEPEIVRASATALLASLSDPDAWPALASALRDASPLVRREAVRALETLPAADRVAAGASLFADASRLVRVEAIAALADVPANALDPALRGAHDSARSEFVAVMRYNADRPESRSQYGTVLAKQGSFLDGDREFVAAIAIDPGYVPAYVNRADMKRIQGQEAEVDRILRDGLVHAPDNGALHYALGLSLVRQKQMEPALRELQRAARAAPDNARFGYVYATALQAMDRLGDARRVVAQALQGNPESRDLLYAAVEFARLAQDQAGMAKALQRLAEVYPDDPLFRHVTRPPAPQ